MFLTYGNEKTTSIQGCPILFRAKREREREVYENIKCDYLGSFNRIQCARSCTRQHSKLIFMVTHHKNTVTSTFVYEESLHCRPAGLLKLRCSLSARNIGDFFNFVKLSPMKNFLFFFVNLYRARCPRTFQVRDISRRENERAY